MSWYSNIWNPRSLIVIYADFSQSGCEFSAGKVTKDDNPPEIQSFESIAEVVGHFGKSKVYHLHLIGSGILSRKVESSNTIHQELIMNGDVNDFLFTSYDDKRSTVVSFCRRSLFEEFVQQFSNEKWHLYGLSSGIIPILTLLEEEKVSFDYDLEVKSDRIATFQRTEITKEKTLWRGGQWTSNELVGKAIYAAIGNKQEQYAVSGDSSQLDRRENFQQFSRFRIVGLSVIGTIFLSLIINYFYQNHLNQRTIELETELSVHNANLSMLEQLTQEKTRKEQLIIGAGVNSSNFLSFYLDNIAATVPKTVKLSEMAVFPVIGKMKNKRKVEIDKERILISGFTQGNEVLDDWMELIDRFEWIESVQLMNYLKSTEKWAEFELELKLMR